MFFNGQTLLCTESFFIFEKGRKYYCSHVDDGHFFIMNKNSVYNVSTIKIPFGLATRFKIII